MNTDQLNINTPEDAKTVFITYVRTRQLFKTRLKGIDESESVHIQQKEIEQRFFVYPEHNRKKELTELVNSEELEITEKESPVTGMRMYLYKALRAGAIDVYLVKPSITVLGENSRLMLENLKRVSLVPGAPSTMYFDAFLKYKNDLTGLFFTMDAFAGRVHTPVTSFGREHRVNLLLDGCPTVGLDVATMQPLLLGKILKQRIGENQYSNWIDAGRDIYVMLQETARLETRDQGKNRFFEILFARPSGSLAEMFGSADWITWINQYKKIQEPGNPHTFKKPYSNLAWLLQTTEVQTMRKVWRSLNLAGIPFLSVHDEIIIKESDKHQAESLFREVLDKEFLFYNLNKKEQTIIKSM